MLRPNHENSNEATYYNTHRNKTYLTDMDHAKKINKLQKIRDTYNRIKIYDKNVTLGTRSTESLAKSYNALKSTRKVQELNAKLAVEKDSNERKLLEAKLDYWDDTPANLMTKLQDDYFTIMVNTDYEDSFIAERLTNLNRAIKRTYTNRVWQSAQWDMLKGTETNKEIRKNIISDLYEDTKELYGLKGYVKDYKFKNLNYYGYATKDEVFFANNLLKEDGLVGYKEASATVMHELEHVFTFNHSNTQVVDAHYSYVDIKDKDARGVTREYLSPHERMNYLLDTKISLEGGSNDFNLAETYLSTYKNTNYTDGSRYAAVEPLVKNLFSKKK